MTRDAANGDRAAEVHGDDRAAYGSRLAADYDTFYPADGLKTEATVDLLAELAERRPDPSVLEFGIGTGRLAIALHRRGLRVAGIEASEQMVAAPRNKAPAAEIEVAIGDLCLDPDRGVVLGCGARTSIYRHPG